LRGGGGSDIRLDEEKALSDHWERAPFFETDTVTGVVGERGSRPAFIILGYANSGLKNKEEERYGGKQILGGEGGGGKIHTTYGIGEAYNAKGYREGV